MHWKPSTHPFILLVFIPFYFISICIRTPILAVFSEHNRQNGKQMAMLDVNSWPEYMKTESNLNYLTVEVFGYIMNPRKKNISISIELYIFWCKIFGQSYDNYICNYVYHICKRIFFQLYCLSNDIVRITHFIEMK